MGILASVGISSLFGTPLLALLGQRLSRQKAELVFAGHENEKGVNGG